MPEQATTSYFYSSSGQGCWPVSQTSAVEEENTQLARSLEDPVRQILTEEKIETSSKIMDALQCLHIPLCRWLVDKQLDRPLVLGINGAQGSGKSTLSRIVGLIMEQGFHKRVVNISIDDLYKTRSQRVRLAKEVHPLLATRGVPGSHDVELGRLLIKQLVSAERTQLAIPRFDKATDDRRPEQDWTTVKVKCDLVIFEGWCVGSVAQDEVNLVSPVNQLERLEDPDGSWRAYVNQQLQTDYNDLFSMIDILLMLKVPDFEHVYQWRQLQEDKLRQSALSSTDDSNKIMTKSELKRFIMHYERITRHTLEEMPRRANIVLELGDDHQIKNVMVRK